MWNVIRRTLLVAVLALVPVPVLAQAADVVVAGKSTLAFDHVAGDTTGYELCVDTATSCLPITVSPAPAGDTSQVYRFTAPVTLPRGPRILRVRPLWAGGTATASDAVTFRVVIEPAKPGPLRPETTPGGN
jgi:hypothetical protein